MKCICGYEQEKPFETYEYHELIRPDIAQVHRLPGLFVCPKCGTVKMDKDGEGDG